MISVVEEVSQGVTSRFMDLFTFVVCHPCQSSPSFTILVFLWFIAIFLEFFYLCENITMASLTYVCFVPAKGLIRGLSANSSNIAFEVPLASKLWWQSGLISNKDFQLRNMPFIAQSVRILQWLALHKYVSSLFLSL